MSLLSCPSARQLYHIESLHPLRHSLTDAMERATIKGTFCIWHVSFSYTFLFLQKSRKERRCMVCLQPCWRPCQEICCFLTFSFTAFIVTCIIYWGWVECEVPGFKSSCTRSRRWCDVSHFDLFNYGIMVFILSMHHPHDIGLVIHNPYRRITHLF